MPRIGEYSHIDIETFFHQIDSDGSGFIDREEFDEFIRMITMERETTTLSPPQQELVSAMESSLKQRTSSAANSSTHHILGDATTINYVSNLLKDDSFGGNPLEDWSVFYCGGSNKIEDNLSKVTSKYNIDFAVEKFDW